MEKIITISPSGIIISFSYWDKIDEASVSLIFKTISSHLISFCFTSIILFDEIF